MLRHLGLLRLSTPCALWSAYRPRRALILWSRSTLEEPGSLELEAFASIGTQPQVPSFVILHGVRRWDNNVVDAGSVPGCERYVPRQHSVYGGPAGKLVSAPKERAVDPTGALSGVGTDQRGGQGFQGDGRP